MNNLVPNFLGATQLGCSPVPKIGWTPEDGLYLRIRLLDSVFQPKWQARPTARVKEHQQKIVCIIHVFLIFMSVWLYLLYA